MRRRIVALAIVAAVLLVVPASGAGPSVAKMARDVATALKIAKRADVNARKALAVAAPVSAGTDGPRGVPGVDGAKGATGTDGAAGPKGETGPAGASGAAGEQGAKGETGLPGVPGTVRAYAHVIDSSLDPSRSTNNVSMERGRNQSVAYCFKVGVPVLSAVVTLDGSMLNASSTRAFVDMPAREACSGWDVSVVLSDPTVGPMSGSYFILFN